MTDGQVKEFELVDFAEKLKNIQKTFTKEVLGSGICFNKLNFIQKDHTFWNRKTLILLKIHTASWKNCDQQ